MNTKITPADVSSPSTDNEVIGKITSTHESAPPTPSRKKLISLAGVFFLLLLTFFLSQNYVDARPILIWEPVEVGVEVSSGSRASTEVLVRARRSVRDVSFVVPEHMRALVSVEPSEVARMKRNEPVTLVLTFSTMGDSGARVENTDSIIGELRVFSGKKAQERDKKEDNDNNKRDTDDENKQGRGEDEEEEDAEREGREGDDEEREDDDRKERYGKELGPALPLTLTVVHNDRATYVSEVGGYSLEYPGGFVVEESEITHERPHLHSLEILETFDSLQSLSFNIYALTRDETITLFKDDTVEISRVIENYNEREWVILQSESQESHFTFTTAFMEENGRTYVASFVSTAQGYEEAFRNVLPSLQIMP